MLYTFNFMKDDFYYIELFEIYKGLLTDTQIKLFSEHYLLDLSYAETAEGSGASRQSVYDAVKRVKLKLDGFESVLKIKKKQDALKLAAEKADSSLREEIFKILGE